MSSSTDNEAGLQALIDAQYALLGAEQALYGSLTHQKNALISVATTGQPNDILSESVVGVDSYTYQSISQQITESAGRLKDLAEELKRLMDIKSDRFPNIIIHTCL
jgi:hypothetical protein